jgi:non-homologous end joining protein Ku
MAGKLVESLHERFRPQSFKDSYRERLLKMIERKAGGEEIEIPEAAEPEQSDDLMAALEASRRAGFAAAVRPSHAVVCRHAGAPARNGADRWRQRWSSG